MKVSYWIVVIVVTCGIAYGIGYVTGQKSKVTTVEIVEPTDISMATESPVNSPANVNAQSQNAEIIPSSSANNAPPTMDNIFTEIDKLLVKLEENPKQRSSAIKLYAILETLSADELIGLGPSLENKSGSQSKMMSQIIIALLIEKAPEQALDFALRYNPMPDTPYYLAAIKMQIAEKRPELGFEYLNQMLTLDKDDIDLGINDRLIAVLAKADLQQLVQILAKFQDMGIKLDGSLTLTSIQLKTSEEYLSLFNELRQLNDMSILNTVIRSWMNISPNAVLDRLNEIEDIAEREKLADSAFFTWMLNSPEAAADHYLMNASNKIEMLKKIMQIWPTKNASDALMWISAQSDIDTNRYKIDYLKRLSYSEPEFVQAHLNEIYLNDGEKIRFYQNLYKSFQRKSSASAEQFLNTLPFKDEVLGTTAENGQPAESRLTKINKAFSRYFDYKHDKAFALALGDNGAFAFSYYVNKSSQSEANQLALKGCEQRRHKHNIDNECKIYAEGDVIMFNLTP